MPRVSSTAHALWSARLTGVPQLPSAQEGVLAHQHLEAAIAAGVIDAGEFKLPRRPAAPIR